MSEELYHTPKLNTKSSDSLSMEDGYNFDSQAHESGRGGLLPAGIGGGRGGAVHYFHVVRCLRRSGLYMGPAFLRLVDVSKARWRFWENFGIVFLIPKFFLNTTLPVPGRSRYCLKKKHFSLRLGLNAHGPGPCVQKMFLFLPSGERRFSPRRSFEGVK